MSAEFDPTKQFKQHLDSLKLFDSPQSGELIQLERVQAKPSGCSFLGAKAASVNIRPISMNNSPLKAIIDSGSDITLISEQTYSTLMPKPKKLTGRKIKLIQVTGSTSINGYIVLPIFFETSSGPVRIDVEAYVVKGMSTPLIIGNDFADQYELSLLRNEGLTQLLLGRSLRTVNVESPFSPSMINEQGETFSVRVREDLVSSFLRSRQHKRNQLKRKKLREFEDGEFVRAKIEVTIPPYYCKRVPIRTEIFSKLPTIYAERIFNTNRRVEDIYAAPDSLINADFPYLQVSNFSNDPVRIKPNQILARKRDPFKFLDDKRSISESKMSKYIRHANLIKSLAKDLKFSPTHDNVPHNPRDEPIEGGPKLSEVPPEDVAHKDLLKEIHISEHLRPEECVKLEKVITDNHSAFGLDGRLGDYPAKIVIRLKPDSQPISLPPFPQSPASQEVMDKQFDTWLQLGVIEPSISPWAALTFISY